MLSAYEVFLLLSNVYLAAAGVFSTIFASFICLALVKHREDHAPMASFFLRLNTTISEIKELIVFGLIFFIIFLLYVFYYLIGSSTELFAVIPLFSVLVQLFGMLDISIMSHVLYRWYKYNFKRFLWSN